MERSGKWRYLHEAYGGEARVSFGGVIRGLFRRVAARSVLLMLVLPFVLVALVSLVGIGASVAVVETVQGSGSAINVAGSLRRLVQRAGTIAAVNALDGRSGKAELAAAVDAFEQRLDDAALRGQLERAPGSLFSSIYRGIEAGWRTRMKPRLLDTGAASGDARDAEHYGELLAEVDAFAAQIDTLVSVLEQDAEAGIEQLRATLGVAMALVTACMLGALYALRRRVFLPLRDLRASAVRVAHGDDAARSTNVSADELGQVAAAFNAMADRLSNANRELERRVDEKTADLTRSNRSLELLYHVISRLYHAPASSETYASTLKDLEQLLGLDGSFVCMLPKHGGPGETLFSSIGECGSRQTSGEACLNCPGRESPWSYRREPGRDVLLVPLRDAEHLYGMMRLALPAGARLQEWQHTLLEAVSRHMGVALGISHQSERKRLLALQEERSIIARELHDSLAQSLTYMKIQASLLSPALTAPDQREDALAILGDLREGINAAYRQLRELLSTFRLRIEGDFARLLGSTVEEYAGRSGIPIDLEIRLSGCHLSPNQEIHVLHIVREALSNATRHAQARHIRVELLSEPGGEIRAVVEDDGQGIPPQPVVEPHHYGLTIMGERARGLGGTLEVGQRHGGGARIVVRFATRSASDAQTIGPEAR
ncbi:histidine kinase [Aromatoleum sp.]|uniref:histidine kinase n=1 Tax=Aromatoleum sp. TaxID=2307007 RepID=UPI002FCCA326